MSNRAETTYDDREVVMPMLRPAGEGIAVEGQKARWQGGAAEGGRWRAFRATARAPLYRRVATDQRSYVCPASSCLLLPACFSALPASSSLPAHPQAVPWQEGRRGRVAGQTPCPPCRYLPQLAGAWRGAASQCLCQPLLMHAEREHGKKAPALRASQRRDKQIRRSRRE